MSRRLASKAFSSSSILDTPANLLQARGPFGASPIRCLGLGWPTPPADRQYILRMPVRHPNTPLRIPRSLWWLKKQIEALDDIRFPYYYVTVRSGFVTSTTDDEWHVDGYSMRVPHVPEVDYIWTNCYPTEFFLGNLVPPEDFDPLKHNLHWWLQDNMEGKGEVLKGYPYAWYKLSPYVVHRRPYVPVGVWRTMVRLSLVPIEIEDPDATPNPLLPVYYPQRTDIRDSLTRYTSVG